MESKAKLRFAALTRVSSEGQATEKHVSLEVQSEQIETAVENMDGRIVGSYGGQEHATPGYEKKEIDRLIRDAARGLFDAICISDPDRWSRDNTKSKEGLTVFREHGIRFFVGEVEQDLFDPNIKLFLGISAEIGEYFAANQKRKSINARIHLAQANRPASGCKPFGRVWDAKSKTWSIDTEKQAVLQSIADRYLAGESLTKLAAEYRMNYSNLYMNLVHRSGTTWEQVFYPKATPTDKGPPLVVNSTIPALLDAATIAAIKEQMAANKTYKHGKLKNTYLLSRMVFCAACGGALSGKTNPKGNRYYRHLPAPYEKECSHAGALVPADELEERVMLDLFDTFGNPKAIQRAIAAASGDLEKIKDYRERLARLDRQLETVQSGRQKILDLILDGRVREAEAKAKFDSANERENRLKDERARLAEFLEGTPTVAEIEDVSERVAEHFQHLTTKVAKAKQKAAQQPFSQVSYEDKRALAETVFSGKTPDGHRMGVFVAWDGKDWTFSVRGHLVSAEGLKRLKPWQKHIRSKFAEAGTDDWAMRQQEKLGQNSKVAHPPSAG